MNPNPAPPNRKKTTPLNINKLQVMRSIDVQLLLESGILDPRADEGTAWMVWGKLCKDPIVAERTRIVKSRPENQPPNDPNLTGIFIYDAVQIVEQEMTAAEKVALRDRVIAACRKSKA
jgi:hypothetical protein